MTATQYQHGENACRPAVQRDTSILIDNAIAQWHDFAERPATPTATQTFSYPLNIHTLWPRAHVELKKS